MKSLLFVVFIQSFLSVNGQNELTGKSYKALVGETCKEMTEGGCMIYTYRILNFSLDSVVVSYQTIAHCSPQEMENSYRNMYDSFTQTYKWTVSRDTLTIYGLEDYGKLMLQHKQITGEDKFTKKAIVFSEE